ncbi:hypothetical protein MNEG_15658 [Monoraphidium neglectum]|uniref:F-box/LRR-repeat protein 15-like leucin rich repeat domain-containing protein n=1 Tax=Monoraphidium neglectum TaxID=145388 RepID=A0A0D2MAA3_9CHLO|nr:hypothetical protein MNEG_15658 [Monoraphidium neglectum]KIY92305.1 hypothetical protein MNEG_15658 [Monoraphidium neglectum]|eukprot:XP_013891325.1 hypothetical protein MNEG_15658 [Monoraphidium neglectum]
MLRPAEHAADDAVILTAAPSLAALTALRLARCPGVTDASLAAVARACPALVELDVSGARQAVTDRGVAALAALSRLRVLSLDGCSRVSAEGVRALLLRAPAGATVPATAAAAPLETLSLAGCAGLSDAALAPIGEALAATLRELRLDGCPQVTNRGLRRLLPLGELRELGLRGTLVQPQGPVWRALRQRVQRLACDPQAGIYCVGLD